MLAGAKVGETGLGTGAGGPRGTTGATTAPTVVQAQEDQEVTTGGTATTTEADTEEAEEASAILETGRVTAGADTTTGPGTTDVAASLQAEGVGVDRPAPP